ncbi:MAG: CPBP family intramembrane metalloprotease [bacterium]|nr:CPBP family intramembrane metalloprotease [bacterium]
MRKLRLAIELFLLFALLPLLYVFDVLKLPVLLILGLFALVCYVILRRDRFFDRQQLWNREGLRRQGPVMLRQFALHAMLIAAGVFFLDRESLLALMRRSPALWALIMLLYPLVSVYPQELIYRAFFFHRYRELFPTRWSVIAASAIAFGFMHIVFENTLAVLLTLAGGWLFAQTYDRSRSLLAVSVQHALYGGFIFTIGLGWYFYHGAVR